MTPVRLSSSSFCSGVPTTSRRLPPPERAFLSPSRIRAEAVLEQPGRLHGLGELADLGEQVVAHPRHRGELDPVGLLVQADPEPEVVRVGLELALDVHDVRRDQQQPAVGGVERVELAEHLRGEEAEHAADLGAGEPGADRGGEPGRRLLLGQLVDDRREQGRERVGVRLHPGGPVDDQDRRGVVAGDQPGELADQPGRAVRARAQLLDDGRGLVATHARPVAGEPGADPDREVPVDHLRATGPVGAVGPERVGHATQPIRRPVGCCRGPLPCTVRRAGAETNSAGPEKR